MRIRYLEILGKEMALQAGKERNFGEVKLKDGIISVKNVTVTDKTIKAKVEALSKEEREKMYEFFHEEFSRILKTGVHHLTVKETVKAGVTKKWD